MKEREGHVSNSSSSSFFLVTTKANYEKALKEVSPFVAAVAKALASNNKFGDMDVVVFGTYSDAGGYGTFDGLDIDASPAEGEKDEYGEKMSAYSAWDLFKDILRKDKSATLSSHIGN
jgi:hypothetical protein